MKPPNRAAFLLPDACLARLILNLFGKTLPDCLANSPAGFEIVKFQVLILLSFFDFRFCGWHNYGCSDMHCVLTRQRTHGRSRLTSKTSQKWGRANLGAALFVVAGAGALR